MTQCNHAGVEQRIGGTYRLQLHLKLRHTVKEAFHVEVGRISRLWKVKFSVDFLLPRPCKGNNSNLREATIFPTRL
jgi:hypothetical protein